MIIVHRKKPNCTIIQGVVFYPGMNTLSDAEYAKIAKNKGFTSEIDCGNMVMTKQIASSTSEAVDSTDQKERASKMVAEVKSAAINEAIALVETMSDPFILKALKESDGRKGIHEAVDKRLTSIRTQEKSDLKPESKEAPLGNGSEEVGKVTGTKEEVEGTKVSSAIPALNKK
jgi:hypothetical protein